MNLWSRYQIVDPCPRHKFRSVLQSFCYVRASARVVQETLGHKVCSVPCSSLFVVVFAADSQAVHKWGECCHATQVRWWERWLASKFCPTLHPGCFGCWARAWVGSVFPFRGACCALLAFSSLTESAVQPPTLEGDLKRKHSERVGAITLTSILGFLLAPRHIPNSISWLWNHIPVVLSGTGRPSTSRLHKQAYWLQHGWTVSWIGVARSSVISCLDAQCDMCTMRQRTCHHPVISPCRSSRINANTIRSIWMVTPDETCSVLPSFAVHSKRTKRNWTGSWKVGAMQRWINRE